MRSINYILFFLSIFVYIIFIAFIYMNLEKKRKFTKDNKVKNFEKENLFYIKNLILKVKNGEELSSKEIYYVKKLMKNKLGRQAFDNIIFNLNKEDFEFYEVKKFISIFSNVLEYDIKKIRKKDIVKKYEFIYYLGEYGVYSPKIVDFLIDSLKIKNIDLRISSLNSIAKIGNVESFIEALIFISKNNIYINKKVLVKIIDKFKDDIKIIYGLLKILNDLNENIQCSIIDNFSKNNYYFLNSYLLNKLKNEENKEVRIALLKYFRENYFEEFSKIIIKFLYSDFWEERAVCAKVASTYYSEAMEGELKKSISDSNWYVRLNSANSIVENTINFKIIEEILLGQDNYAKEILLYSLKAKDEKNYNNILRSLEEKDLILC